MFLPRLALCALVVLSLFAPRFVCAQIHADVTVAGAVNGTFTIDLEYAKVPATVASFVGLATGQRPWIDLTTGAIRTTPFYNGVTFHRVMAGFMNQTGSRNGFGTDGPGYAFKDEFDPTLRHDGAYVVSMANSGRHTNGSQFFITAAAQPHLNDVHSVFGRVIAGQAVCDAINATPVSGTVPVTPITIQSISVYGASLPGLNLFPTALPTVLDARPVLSKSGATYTLAYDASTYSSYTGYRSGDLSAWGLFKSSYSPPGAPPSGSDNVTSLATGARHFFRMARVDYSGSANPLTPASIAGRTFTFTSNFPYQIIVAVNAAGTGGTWQMPGLDSGTLIAVVHTPGSYTSFMRFVFNPGAVITGSVDLRPTVEYTSATSGPFAGTTNFISYQSLNGTFTVTP